MDKPVILCIGTGNIIGDSLGPAVGDLLIMKHNIDAYVYGSTSRPVHGVNYSDYLGHIKKHHSRNFIIAVDACMGEKKDVGRIKCSKKGLVAGGALNKGWSRVGNLGIVGIVAAAQKDNFEELKKVDAALIQALAGGIAHLVCSLITRLKNIYEKNAV